MNTQRVLESVFLLMTFNCRIFSTTITMWYDWYGCILYIHKLYIYIYIYIIMTLGEQNSLMWCNCHIAHSSLIHVIAKVISLYVKNIYLFGSIKQKPNTRYPNGWCQWPDKLRKTYLCKLNIPFDISLWNILALYYI